MPAPNGPRPGDDDGPQGPDWKLPFHDHGGLDLTVGRGEPVLQRTFLAVRSFALHAALAAALVFLALLFLGLLALAGSGDRSEFEIALYTELLAGVAMFAILPVALALSETWPWRTNGLLLLLSIGSGLAAYHSAGIGRSLLLEGAAGLMTIVILDSVFASLLRRLASEAPRAEHEYRQFVEEWDE